MRVRVPPRPPSIQEESIKSKIKLTGIKAIGYHGVNDGEQDRPQTFYIDVEMVVDFDEDSIDHTQDYRQVSELVKKVVEQKNFKLIETMAFSIAKKLHALGKASGIRVVVHKPAAAKSLFVEDVTAEFMISGKN